MNIFQKEFEGLKAVLTQEKIPEDKAIIVDLRERGILVAPPVFRAYDSCECKTVKQKEAHHCPLCGTSSINLNYQNYSYDEYTILYKLLTILTDLGYKNIAVISRYMIPEDFVSNLSKSRFLDVNELKHRRTLIHLDNSVAYITEENELIPPTRGVITYMTLLSNNKNLKEVYRGSVIHTSKYRPLVHVKHIFSSYGVRGADYISSNEVIKL